MQHLMSSYNAYWWSSWGIWQMPLSQATFDQSMRSLGVEPMTLVSLAPCFNAWVTGKLFAPQSSWTTTKRRFSNTWASLKLNLVRASHERSSWSCFGWFGPIFIGERTQTQFVYNVRYSMCCIKVISHSWCYLHTCINYLSIIFV